MTGPSRIVVVGGDAAEQARVAARLADAGYPTCEFSPHLAHVLADLPDSSSARSATLSEDAAPEPPPPIDLLILVGPDLAHDCAEVRVRTGLADTALVAWLTEPFAEAAPAAALGAGADEVLTPRRRERELSLRLAAALRVSGERRELRVASQCEEALLDIQATFAFSADFTGALREALIRSVEVLGYDRAAIIATGDDPEVGYIVAASDDLALTRIPLRLADYPELRACMESRETLVIEDAQTHPLMKSVAHIMPERVRAAALFPLVAASRRSVGAVFMRSEAVQSRPRARLLSFGRLFAGLVGSMLKEGKVREILHEQTNRLNLARYEIERRSRAIDASREFFESASDGVVIVADGGTILYINRATEDLTGFARGGLVGQSLLALVPENQQEGLGECLTHVIGGENLQPFDINLLTTSGDPVTVNVSTSTLLSEHACAVLSFRDVTEVRSLHYELSKTKEFLERLIFSTVDAIVAADMRGKIILFNPGAERIYGRKAKDVVGTMSVKALYPEGVAQDIMRELRGAGQGGQGRLETHRRDICSASGELIPVELTASIIYEDGREVATVGIFSDQRERVRIEERLRQAQDKLVVSEKQAIIAELAGTTAHELNQPLTSIMGYCELIKRKLASDHPHARAIDIILREAERMAEIVRKIARITRYETKSYVGGATILDLDKSTNQG